MRFTLLFVASLHGSADPWFGADKIKHFFMSAFVQSLSYSSLRAVDAEHGQALLGASAVTLTLGVGKEIHDVRRYGDFSVRDLAWDLAGGASASLLLSQTRR